ncbi:TPA: hypothetical protein ACGXM3_005289 [Bacillus cereus]
MSPTLLVILSFGITCISPFVGIAIGAMLDTDGMGMALLAFLTTILGFFITIGMIAVNY